MRETPAKFQYLFYSAMALILLGGSVSAQPTADWQIETTAQWQEACQASENLNFEDDLATPTKSTSQYTSVIHKFNSPVSPASVTFRQSPAWHNWEPIENLGPSNLLDAPVLLVKGPKDYWMFGRYGKPGNKQSFQAEDAELEGFDIPLKTTTFPNQYDAPGGLEKGLGGYHAWQSRDMLNWVHHGPVTDDRAKWVTTAEYLDGKTYIYYDFPNDQDPHVYVDDDLYDGKLGRDVGIVFKDPTHGSDCGIIRALDGVFHVIAEDWSPINASQNAWDSPIATHAISADGLDFNQILDPPVDERTTPTGVTKTYNHPHWKKEDPVRFPSNVAEYEVHEPKQRAFGDWAPIAIGDQYYLFADYDYHGQEMRVAWFTSSDINQPFERCGEIGRGHPDPDIAFAEGKFYLATQMKTDYVSPGPWVEEVKARVGVDTTNDGNIDTWTEWSPVTEQYDYTEGFSKQVARTPASIDCSDLPACYGISFEFQTRDATDNASMPILDSVTVSFK